MFGFITKHEIDFLRETIVSLQKDIFELRERKPEKLPEDLGGRVAELEIKVAKLWTVLIKIDQRGTERPTNTARKMFGGKVLRQDSQ
jgi:hypothetical protein